MTMDHQDTSEEACAADVDVDVNVETGDERSRPEARDTRSTNPASDDVAEMMGSGSTLRDLHAVPERVMSGIHAYAYEFYQKGRLAEAEAFFRFLCLYDFYNADYAMGLAAVFQLQGRYRQAIDLYGVAMRLGFGDPMPVFHAGQCFLKLGENDDARECFAFVVDEAKDASVRDRASAYLASLGGRLTDDALSFDRTDSLEKGEKSNE